MQRQIHHTKETFSSLKYDQHPLLIRNSSAAQHIVVSFHLLFILNVYEIPAYTLMHNYILNKSYISEDTSNSSKFHSSRVLNDEEHRPKYFIVL